MASAGRPRKEIPDEKLQPLTIKLTPRVAALIGNLASSGFFGQSKRDVVERLLVERLRELFAWEESEKIAVRQRSTGG
jgi:hypothetical protein